MDVVILAGGLGTRLGYLTEDVPKPMMNVGGIPIIQHIINHYKQYGYFRYLIAGGYKVNVLQEYFKNNKDNVFVFDTGVDSQTGGRIKKLKDIITGDVFLMTYGDGLSDVNINAILTYHSLKNSMCTVTAVRPPARFGRVKFDKTGKVTHFVEKATQDEGWINGGYFVCNKEIINYIENNTTQFEKEPMLRMAEDGVLYARKHEKFWIAVDTQTDLNYVNSLVKEGETPWNGKM